nr:hypothetical protein [Tanacetum cinerariifolium]
MSSDSHATVTYTSMSSYEVTINEYYVMHMDPFDPYVQLVMGAPPSPDYIPGPEAPPSPDYIPGPEAPPSPDYIQGQSTQNSEEEEEEHLAPTVPAPTQYSSVSESDETEPFEEGETAATPPPFGYRIAARISIQPHIFMPFRTESEVERLLAIPTPPLSPVSLTPYTLPPFL